MNLGSIIAFVVPPAGMVDAGLGHDLGRELVVAVVALLLFMVTAPRGRRLLSWGPAALLGLGPLRLAVAARFRGARDGPRLAAVGIRCC
ncbi:MAG: hypothetical protein ACKOHG_10945, partial [Planctomycetia bacterium]